MSIEGIKTTEWLFKEQKEADKFRKQLWTLKKILGPKIKQFNCLIDSGTDNAVYSLYLNKDEIVWLRDILSPVQKEKSDKVAERDC